jgi:hypothetical protein
VPDRQSYLTESVHEKNVLKSGFEKVISRTNPSLYPILLVIIKDELTDLFGN